MLAALFLLPLVAALAVIASKGAAIEPAGFDTWLIGGFALVALVLLIVAGEVLLRGQKLSPPKKQVDGQKK